MRTLIAILAVLGSLGSAASAAPVCTTFATGVCCSGADGTNCKAPAVVCTNNSACAAQAPFSVCAGASADGAQAASTTPTTYASLGFSQCFSTAALLGVSRSFTGSTYAVNNGVLQWDTSALPDNAVVTGATLTVRVTSVDNADGRNLQGEWFTWGASCSASSWSAVAANSAFDVPNSSIVANADQAIALTAGLGNISLTGRTYLRVHESGGQPTGFNRVVFADYDNTTLPGPRLQVCYELPTSTPTATVTATPTVSNTPSATVANTSTATATDSSSPTPTVTVTATSIGTPVDTFTSTATSLATPTETAPALPTDTPTSGPTDTPTSTPTLTETLFPSRTATPTSTWTSTVPPSPTATSTATSTQTSTATGAPVWPINPFTSAAAPTNDYGTYSSAVGNAYHTGMDIAGLANPCSYNTPVFAGVSGSVAFIQQLGPCATPPVGSCAGSGCADGALGRTVVVRGDDGLYRLYGHMDSIAAGLSVGQPVTATTQVGVMGNSAGGVSRRGFCPGVPTCASGGAFPPHLHFELKAAPVLGAPANPPVQGYTFVAPPYFGYRDPVGRIEPITPMPPAVVRVVATQINVRANPGTQLLSLGTVAQGARFVAFERSGAWFHIHLAATANEPLDGWIAETDPSCANGQCSVIDTNAATIAVVVKSAATGGANNPNSGVSALNQPTNSGTLLARLWEGQALVVLATAPPNVGEDCIGNWLSVQSIVNTWVCSQSATQGLLVQTTTTPPCYCQSPGACESAAGATCTGGVCQYPPATGSSCDDGNLCTANDTCNAQKQCVGAPFTCGSPGVCQTGAGVCNGSGCDYTPAPVGSACDDGTACTANDTCNAQQACVGTPLCDTCQSCDPGLGICGGPPCTATPLATPTATASPTPTATPSGRVCRTFATGICCDSADGTNCKSPAVVCANNNTCASQAPFSVCGGASADGAQAASTSSATLAGVAFSQCFPTAALIGVSRSFNGSTYAVNNGLLQWDTGALPDNAIVTDATLTVRVSTVDNADGRNLQGEWFNWGASCGASDWTATAASTAFDAPNANIVANADNAIPLNAVTGNVNTVGRTYLRLHESGGSITGVNRVIFADYDNTTLPGPRLQVCYVLPTPPSPTPTRSATPSASATSTATATVPATSTAVDTPTLVPTATQVATSTGTSTSTPTESLTPTTAYTATETPTGVATPTNSMPATATDTPTATALGTATDTIAPTPSSTPTETSSSTATNSPTPTDTPTATALGTATDTAAPTPSSTPTETSNSTATNSPTPTETGTPVPTPTATRTATSTPSATPNPTICTTFATGVCCSSADGTSCKAPAVVCTSNSACAAQAPFSVCAGASADGAQAASTAPTAYAGLGFSQCFSTAALLGVSRSFTGSTYAVNNGLLQWDTSALPDSAVVTGATLTVRVASVDNADGRNLQGEWFPWGASCSASSWTAVAASTAFDVPNSSIVANADKAIALTGGLGNINASGRTYLRVHESGGQPTGFNRVVFADYDNTTLPGPRLQVCYALPTPSGAATSTPSATSSSADTATFTPTPTPTIWIPPSVDAGPDRLGVVGQNVSLQGSVSHLSPIDFWVGDTAGSVNNHLVMYNSVTGTTLSPRSLQTTGGAIYGWPSDLLRINGVVYGIDTFWRQLYTLDPATAYVTPIIPSPNNNPFFMSSLAYDATHDALYVSDYDAGTISTLSRSTGVAAFLLQLPLADVHALEYVNGVLYCIDNATQALYSFLPNPSAPQLTFRCSLPFNSGELYDELTYFRGEFYGAFTYFVGATQIAQVRKINIATGQTTDIGPPISNSKCHSLLINSLPEDVRWSVVSGPGSVTFSDASNPQSTATFSQPGTYVLMLTVFADPTPLTDTVTVTVQ